MGKATLVFDGLDGGPANVNRAQFSDTKGSPQPLPALLCYDRESGHWQFPSRAVNWDSDGPTDQRPVDDTQTVSVPRENVYSVTSERKSPTLDPAEVVETDVTVAYEAVPGEYSSITPESHDFLELPRFDAETDHWVVAFSPTDRLEDDQRLVYEKQIPRESVRYVRGVDEL